MKRILSIAILVTCCLAVRAFGDSTPLLPPIPVPSGLKAFNIGKMVINPIAQFGYQKIGCNLTFPIDVQTVVPIDNRLQVGNLDMWLEDAGFWTGTLGANVEINPKLAIFGSAGGFVPRNIVAPSMLPVRINAVTLPSKMYFDGTSVEYWIIQAGAAVSVGGGWSVLAGYLWDHFGLVAENPRIDSIPFPNQTLKADFLSKTSVPFIGLQFTELQLKYRASILYSPIARNWCLVSNSSHFGAETDLSYLFDNLGQFLAVNGEYDVELDRSTYFSLWLTATWMKATGSGTMEYKSTAPAIDFSRSEINASIAKYGLAGGVGLGMAF
jgi:hypothetical protein